MTDEIRTIVEAQRKWAWWRCHDVAEALVKGGSDDTRARVAAVKELADEMLQGVMDRFVQRTREGFFLQKPRVNREAQVRTLLQFCILQEKTAQIRALRIDLRAVREGTEDVEGEDVVERIPDGGPNAEEGAIARQTRDGVLTAVQRLSHPVRKLVVMGIFAREMITRADVDAAAEHVASGKRFVVRPAAEVWELIERTRVDPAVDGDAMWRRAFAETLRFDLPFGDADDAAVSLAVNALEKQLERGLVDLREALADGDEEAGE